jgi:hypothetical protein
MHGETVTKLKPKTSIQSELITVTPEKATELLEHNRLNRPLAAQIIAGKWRFNGDTIKIAATGDVLDGQHRLWAVIEAKRPIDTLIVYGVEREAFATIDTLRKVRSGGDVLSLNGASRYRNIMASALQWLVRWQRGVLPEWKSPQNKIENSDIEGAYADNPGIVNAVERAVALRTVANPSLLGFFYYVLASRNEELAERMMQTLENPAGVGVNDPFFRLRSYFISDHQKQKIPLVSIALCVKAANAAHAKRPVQNLTWKNQGKTLEPFPTLAVSMAKLSKQAA